MKKKIPQYIARNRHLLKYCVESLIHLTICKSLISIFSHKHWGFQTGYFQCETLKENMLHLHAELLAIQRSLRFVAKYLPWRSKCLDQALAAQRMLSRRKLSNTLYFGMIKDEQRKWSAHAWVRCGDTWIIGHHPGKDYAIVATYAKIL